MKVKQRRLLTNHWFHIAILFLVLIAAVYYSGSEHDIRQRLQYATFDTYNKIKPREPSNQVAIIDLDEASLKEMGQWPWPRTTMAQMVTRLKDMGVKITAFDMVFAESDRTSPARIADSLPKTEDYEPAITMLSDMPDNDVEFAKAIAEAGNVVTGFTGARPEETIRRPYQGQKPTFLVSDKAPFFERTFPAQGVVTNLPELSMAAVGNGSFMATPDVDGVVRRVSLFVRYPPEDTDTVKTQIYPSLSLEVLRTSINKDARLLVKENKNRGPLDTQYAIKIADFEVPIEGDSKIWTYYRTIEDSEYISAYKLFDPAFDMELREKLKDKIVFVGTSAEGLRDIRSTPLDIFVPGVEVHVNIVEQILQGKFLTRPDVIIGMEAFIIAVAGFLIIVLAPFINIIILGIFTLLLMAGMFYGSWMMFVQQGILLDPVYPSAALSALFMASTLLSYMRAEAEKAQIRGAFGLYVSPDFMKELTKDPDKLVLGGEVKDLSVMFTDIRSFTTISESLSPDELIQLMNDFLTPMSDLVMEYRGTIDKYMGDAMMAFWNAPLDDPNHARHACIVALKMDEALVPINARLAQKAAKEGGKPLVLNAGIGINSGPASVGNMGSKQRFAYSALGDTVNLASRLESQTKSYGVNILIGEQTQKSVPDFAAPELDLLQVKGKTKPVKVFTLLGDEKFASDKNYQTWMTAHNTMLASYRTGDFDCAAQDLKDAREAMRAVESVDLNFYYDLYADRIIELIKNPPADNWDGVFVATSK